MTLRTATMASLLLLTAWSAQAQQPDLENRRLSPEDVRRAAPTLEAYTRDTLYGDVWKRPGLDRRDRSLVTIATLITRSQFQALTYYFGQALDNGVKPGEISETIVHLAFYAGFGNAFGAIGPARDVFAQRGIAPETLPKAEAVLLPLNENAEAARAKNVGEMFDTVSPNLVKDTTDVLFRNLWLRPDLAPRDRSLVTVSALIASGQSAQIPYHLGRAMDAGLTREQAGEVISHIAYYAGWPSAFSAMAVAKTVFEARGK